MRPVVHETHTPSYLPATATSNCFGIYHTMKLVLLFLSIAPSILTPEVGAVTTSVAGGGSEFRPVTIEPNEFIGQNYLSRVVGVMKDYNNIVSRRRQLAPFQLCLLCKCCAAATCATMRCCFGIDCQLPNKPYGVCAFVPKTCNCTSCAS